MKKEKKGNDEVCPPGVLSERLLIGQSTLSEPVLAKALGPLITLTPTVFVIAGLLSMVQMQAIYLCSILPVELKEQQKLVLLYVIMLLLSLPPL